MSDTKEIYYDKDQGRFEWIGDRRSPAIEAEISSASYDAPWLEFDGLTPEELCKRWNNHERLVEALMECCQDLANEVCAKHYAELGGESTEAEYEEDMESVRKARALLDEIRKGESSES